MCLWVISTVGFSIMRIISPIFVVFLLCSASVDGAAYPVGNERAMVVGSGHQSSPRLALWDSGEGLVVWENASSTGFKRIVVQALGANGRSVGGMQVVSQNVNKVHDSDPEIALIDENKAVVVWASGNRGNKEIYMALVSRNGSRLSEVQRVNQTESQNQDEPGVGVSSDGTIAVVWQSEGQDGDNCGVYGRIYSKEGIAIGGELLLSQTTAGDQSQPGVLGLDENRFLMTWTGSVINGRNGNGGLKLQSYVMGRFFRGGSAQQNEFRISGSDVIVQSPVTHRGSDGQIHAGWMQRTDINSQDKYDIWGVSLNGQTGLPASNPRQINEFSSGQQLSPKIVSHGDEVVYVWESVGQDLGGHGIVGRCYPAGKEFVINSQRNLDQYDPAVAVTGQGTVIVAWANTIRSDQSIISSQHFVIGSGPPTDNPAVASETESALELESVSSTPAAPSFTPAVDVATAPTVLGSGNTSAAASATVENAPSFPRPASPASVAAAVAQNTRSGSVTPGGVSRPAVSGVSRGFGLGDRFPTRASLRSGITTPGQAAQSALRQLSTRGIQNNRFAGSGGSLRPSRSGSGASLSRSGMLDPRMMRALGSQFGSRTGLQASRSPGAAGFSARNSAGIGAARGLPPGLSSRMGGQRRSGGTSTAPSGLMTRAMSAQSRFTQMRQDAQRTGLPGQREVPAGLQSNGNQFSISWQARNGVRYQVQGSNDRVNWSNHGGIRSGTGSTQAVVDRSFRFYRVVERN